MIVLDASASLAWSFTDQRTPALLALATRVLNEGAIAPQLWPIEVAHVVLRARRRGKIAPGQDTVILSNLEALGVLIDSETVDRIWQTTIILAGKHGLTVYDATYLELAIRKQLPLATLDDELIAAARAEGLAVLP